MELRFLKRASFVRALAALVAVTCLVEVAAALPLVQTGTEDGRGAFSQLPIQPRDGQTIAFATTSYTYLGDTLIWSFSKIAALHHAFPHSKIKVISAYSGLLRPSPWLIPVILDPSAGDGGFAITRAAQDAIEARLDADDFGIIDRSNSVVEAAMRRRRLTGMTIVSGAEGGKLRFAARLLGAAFDPHWIETKILAQTDNVYATEDANIRALFGEGAQRPAELFVDLKTEVPQVRPLVSRLLGERAQRYSCINLNTAGSVKVELLKPIYVATMKDLIDSALRADPGQGVLITRPEAQFGEEIRRGTDALVPSYGGRVAYFPEDKSTWLPIIHESRFVVTQDSGFAHIALLVKPEDRVMTLGFDPASQVESGRLRYWIKGQQPYHVVSSVKGAQVNFAPVSDWISIQAGMGDHDVQAILNQDPADRQAAVSALLDRGFEISPEVDPASYSRFLREIATAAGQPVGHRKAFNWVAHQLTANPARAPELDAFLGSESATVLRAIVDAVATSQRPILRQITEPKLWEAMLEHGKALLSLASKSERAKGIALLAQARSQRTGKSLTSVFKEILAEEAESGRPEAAVHAYLSTISQDADADRQIIALINELPSNHATGAVKSLLVDAVKSSNLEYGQRWSLVELLVNRMSPPEGEGPALVRKRVRIAMAPYEPRWGVNGIFEQLLRNQDANVRDEAAEILEEAIQRKVLKGDGYNPPLPASIRSASWSYRGELIAKFREDSNPRWLTRLALLFPEESEVQRLLADELRSPDMSRALMAFAVLQLEYAHPELRDAVAQFRIRVTPAREHCYQDGLIHLSEPPPKPGAPPAP